jgi:hypothetical protein
MNKVQTSILGAGLLISGLLSIPMAVSAQGGETLNQAPQSTTGNGTTGTTGTTTQNNDDSGFDARWLLPLLAIPILYLLTRKRDNREERRDTNQYAAGAKGGRSRRRNDDE